MNVINLLQTQPGFTTSARIFDYDYLLYVHQGKGVYKIGSCSYHAAMGDLFYCPPGIPNTIQADSQDPFLLSGIEFLAPDYRSSIPRKTSLLNHRYLTDTVMEMVREYQFGRTGSGKICDCLLCALLENLVRLESGGIPGRDSAEELLEYLAQNYHRPISHEALASRFCYHKNTINRMLERKTGQSLKSYLITLRTQKACELLKYSDHSVSQIAEFCGYSSSIYFCRQFHEKIGMTPGQFRNAYGGSSAKAGTVLSADNSPD